MNSHSYSGIESAYNLKWSRHINSIVAKGPGQFRLLRRAPKSADTTTIQQAFNTVVKVILEYRCPVCSNVVVRKLY